MRRLYLDHNATSPLRDEVKAAIVEFLSSDAANPGSVHREGQQARSILEGARRQLLSALPGAEGSLTFTSGATEANNMLLNTYAKRGPLVLSPLDHPSVVATGESLEEFGREVRWLEHKPNGQIAPESLRGLLPEASLCSVTWANNELGVWQDIDRLMAETTDADVPLHLDAAQVYGRFPLPDISGVSALTLSAHKAGGPAGIGALYLRKDASVDSMIVGGHQERGRRPGTENLIGVVGWSALMREFDAKRWSKLQPLKAQIEEELVDTYVASVNGAGAPRMAHTSNLSIPGMESEELIMSLDLEGVSVSAGSACTAGSLELSPVLLSLGLSEKQAGSSIRLSLGPEWTGDMVDEFLERLGRVIHRSNLTG